MDNLRGDPCWLDGTDEKCHHRQAQHVGSFGSWSMDLTDGSVAWTKGICPIFELSPDGGPIEYDEVLTYVDSEDRERVARNRNAVLDGEPFDIEYRIDVDGDTRWIRERVEIERNDDGTANQAVGVIQEITPYEERKRELELFRTLVDHSNDGFYVIDPENSEILDVNEEACRMLGYTQAELLSMSVPDINPEFSLEMWDEFVDTVRETGSKTIEGEHRCKGGTTIPVEIQISYVSLDRDYHVATVRDITERKERERELEAARKRYQTLIDAAPDPIFVADAETGEIVEVNAAAAELRKQPRDEIVGTHQSALHPDDEGKRYRELFEQHVGTNKTVKEFDDGTPVYLTTNTGELIPVWISVATVSLGEQTLIHGIFRDISEQHRYEESLEGINQAAQELLQCESDLEIATTVTAAASEMLDSAGTAVYLYDEQRGELHPVAYSDTLEMLLNDVPRFPPGTSIAWDVFTTQEPVQYDDVRTTDDVYNAGTPIRSEIIVPLGKHGVVIVGDTQVAAFDNLTVDLTETLAATAEAALDRAEQSQELRKQRRESEIQAQRLQRAHRLNEEVRTIMRALVEARSHETINQQVCEALRSLDQFAAVWIGNPDFSTGELDVTARAGVSQQFDLRETLNLKTDNSHPAVRVVHQRATVTEGNIAASPQREDWRNRALLDDFKSIISIPLVHNDILYGVLTIYSSQTEAFNELTTSALTELGRLIGLTRKMVDQRNTLLQNTTDTITFAFTAGEDALVRLAGRVSMELSIENISTRSDETYLVHFTTDDGDHDQVQAVTDEMPEFEAVQLLSDDGATQYEAVLIGDCVATTVAELGASIQSMSVTGDRCRLDVTISERRDRQAFIEHLREQYPDIDLVAQRDETVPTTVSCRQLLNESLTERQQDILMTAYYSGYFDRTRRRTGDEIAQSLDISQPAFSTQLRAAQRNLFASLLDENTGR